MNIIIAKDYDTLGRIAATRFAAQVIQKPNAVLGFATGSSPLSTYAAMIKLYREGIVDFSKARTFNLDEYCGLSRDHEQSYYKFMFDNLFTHINVDPKNVHLPDGLAKDFSAHCREYEAEIDAAGGIDLQILGIGTNGHIGFNEPEPAFSPITHRVALTENTIRDNQRFFKSFDDVPKFALSMGIGSIMRARSIVLVASGKSKAEVIKGMVKGEITPDLPASILQLHCDVTVVLDSAAASLL